MNAIHQLPNLKELNPGAKGISIEESCTQRCHLPLSSNSQERKEAQEQNKNWILKSGAASKPFSRCHLRRLDLARNSQAAPRTLKC